MALLTVALAAPAVSGAAPLRYTPVLQSVLSTPRWYKGDDGRYHLQYEVKLTNATSVPIEVRSLQVRGQAGRRVTTLSGEGLKAATGELGSPTVPTTTLPANGVDIVFVNLSFSSRARIPTRITHRLTIDIGLVTSDGLGPVFVSDGGQAAVSRRAPTVIGPPLRGARWVSVIGAHRKGLTPVNNALHLGERFAVDYSARLDAQGRTHQGPVDQNASYFNDGEPVVAVADAKVVSVLDRFPDQIPLASKPTTLGDADGNHVILRLSSGVYAAYAHLQRGSVRVRVGRTVHTGQVLGRLGNSGNSSGPHLHFQLMTRPSFLDADGLPFVTDRFRFDGRIPTLDALIDADSDPASPPVPYSDAGAGNRRLEGFTGLEVVTFPKR
jgi:Peptidase family M23